MPSSSSAEGAEVVAGDPAVQLLPAAADGLQGLGEDRLEGAELGVDVGVGVAAQGLRVVAALGGVLVLVALLVDGRAGAEQLLAAAADGAEGLGEDDLEVGELGVDVVVGLGADLLGLLAGLGQDAVGLGLGAAGDLGVGDQRAALGVRGLDDPVGLLAGLARPSARGRRSAPGPAARESGRAARTSSSRASSSARLTTHEADMGIDRALETAATISSSFFCTSTGARHSLRCVETDGRLYGHGVRDTGDGRQCSVLAQPFVERLQDQRRHQVGDVAAPGRDLLDQGGGQEAVGGVGGDEQRLDAGEAVVHLGHLQLVVEVADRAQALDDGRDVALLAEVDEQAVEGLDPDVAVLGGDLADQVDPLLDRRTGPSWTC